VIVKPAGGTGAVAVPFITELGFPAVVKALKSAVLAPIDDGQNFTFVVQVCPGANMPLTQVPGGLKSNLKSIWFGVIDEFFSLACSYFLARRAS
jgi:hypothetical protein